ncbi:hypothetical protein KKH27_09610 [bacterium]|nr:hypothetical protein [bacterium]MBU1984251.1 hypothetical protein [bacterium]
MLRMMTTLFVLLLIALPTWPQSPEALKASPTDFQARIVEAEANTHLQIEALTAGMETLDPAQREALDRQCVEIKRQGEIQRLEILLEWAQAEGDEVKVTEVRQALETWRNPPEGQVLPQIPRDETPGARTNDNSRNQ